MSYININEVDKTVQDLAAVNSDNIVYVPLNSTDGPSGVYNVLYDYGDFVSLYGYDPNKSTDMMTSWEFAANLLLRKMPVMVRRITRPIDDEGNDIPDQVLEGASQATGILKVNDVTHSYRPSTSDLETVEVPMVDEPKFRGNADKNAISTFVMRSTSNLATPLVNSSSIKTNGVAIKVNDVVTEFEVNPDNDAKYSKGGGFRLQNVHESEPMYITNICMGNLKYKTANISDLFDHTQVDVSSTNKTVLNAYEIAGEKITCNKDNLWNKVPFSSALENGYLIFKNEKGNVIDKSNVCFVNVLAHEKSADKKLVALELPAGYTMEYSLDFGDCEFEVSVVTNAASINNDAYTISPVFEMSSFVSAQGMNTLAVICESRQVEEEIVIGQDATGKDITEVKKFIVPEVALDMTYLTKVSDGKLSSTPEYDINGNINLLLSTYRYIGARGSEFNMSLRTTDCDGIYLQIYDGTTRVETIKLVDLRYRNEKGRYCYYDLYADKEIIWNLFLRNFGLKYPLAPGEVVGKSSLLETTYLDVKFNDNLNTQDLRYLDSIYMCRGDVLNPLTGGSCPSDDCVYHEVHKTYEPLKDKYLYDLKFVSNGAFVDAAIDPSALTKIPQLDEETRWTEDAQIDLAQTRGDCIAFLDIPESVNKDDATEYFQHTSTSYATCYAPWVKLNLLTDTTKWCPGSFAALWTIARSVANGNEVYAPPAGVNRARLLECEDLAYVVPSTYIDTWQENNTQFVNPIIYINGYGVCIFGQRTLYNRVDASTSVDSALQYLNVRLIANEIKKKIFKTCIELTFEYNNLHTWLEFKARMSELLDKLLYNQSISYYDVKMDETTMTDVDIRSNHIVGIVSVAVNNTAEKFDITFELLPNQVNFISSGSDSSSAN